MNDETAVEGMRGLHCQELIDQLWLKEGVLSMKKGMLPSAKDMPSRCQSMPTLPMAPEYCVNGAARISVNVGL